MANKFGMAQDPTISSCALCGERVEHLDKIVVESETIHKTCFKCSLCGCKLQMGHCAADRALYGRYGPRWYCSLVCSTRPLHEKEAKLKEMGVQLRQNPKKKESETALSSNDESAAFECPSEAVLKDSSKKLKIEFTPDASKLWGSIVFKKVSPTSENIKTHEWKSPNVFTCLSLFFTGKIDKCHSILDTVNSAFRDDLIHAGSLLRAEIDKLFSSTTASDEHLNFIAKFLGCRIGIYENRKLKKFGNWKGGSNALTIILSHSDGLYSIVLDL